MTASVLLIFGTSHVGKTTLATHLGEALGWPVVSTDKLARHPGRPWPDVRQPVAEFYAKLTDETIYWFLRTHHDNMWPSLSQQIDAARETGKGCIFEGSALRPEFIGTLEDRGIRAIGLHADPGFLRDRMYAESRFLERDRASQFLIDRFVARSLRDNETVVQDAVRLGLPLTDVAIAGSIDRVTEQLLSDLET